MNISARIRSLISHAMTAAEIHELMPDVDVKLIRGCIQTMVKVDLLERIGDSKPYLYQVARPLKQKLRGYEKVMAVSKAQQIRDWLKEHGPATNAQVSAGVGIKPKASSNTLFDMKKRGYVSRSEDGIFTFICDPEPVQAMSQEARREAWRLNCQRQRDKALRASPPKLPATKKIVTKVSTKNETAQPTIVKYQTVDEWLAQGGVIDRSPTPLPFERLSRADIDMSYRAASTAQLRTTRTYLVG